MKAILRYSIMGLGVTTLLSSCGLIGSLMKEKIEVTTQTADQILLVASLGEEGQSGQIESYLLNPATLSTQKTGTTVIKAPTYLTLDPDGNLLYATNELKDEATVSSYQFNSKTGSLTPLNQSLVLGAEPTYLSIQKDKVVTANYGGGSITMLYRDQTGSLGQADWRVELGEVGVSHPHAVVFSQDGQHLFVPDLGQDRIYHFNVSNGTPPLTIDDKEVELPAGTGPRHLVFDSKGGFAYLIAEKSPNIFVFAHKDGILSLIQTVNTGEHSTGAHIALSHDGRFLYTSFRSGENGILIHSIGKDGKITQVGFTETEAHPRQFALSPDGLFIAVATRDSHSVTFFKRDPQNGTLTQTGIKMNVPRPVFILWTEVR